MRAIGEKDQQAFNELYSRYSSWVYVLLKRKLGDEDCAKDFSQNVWMYIWNTASSLPELRNFQGFLYVVLSRHVYHMAKWRKGQFHIRLEEAPETENIADTSNTESHVIAEEIRRITRTAIGLCPKMQQRIFRLRNNDFSTEETANILSIAPKTVRNGYSEVKKKIQERLVKLGVAAFSLIPAVFSVLTNFPSNTINP